MGVNIKIERCIECNHLCQLPQYVEKLKQNGTLLSIEQARTKIRTDPKSPIIYSTERDSTLIFVDTGNNFIPPVTNSGERVKRCEVVVSRG